MKTRIFILIALVCFISARAETSKTIRIGAVQAKNRSVNFHLSPDEALAAAERVERDLPVARAVLLVRDHAVARAVQHWVAAARRHEPRHPIHPVGHCEAMRRGSCTPVG